MQYAIKDACDVFLLDRVTRKPRLFSDYANSTNLAFTSDRTFARAKGVNKIAFDSNREGTFNIEFEVFDLAWISILLGASDEKETIGINEREVLKVRALQTIELKEEPALFYNEMIDAGILGIIQSSPVPITALYDRKNIDNMNWDNLPKVPDIKLNEHQFALF